MAISIRYPSTPNLLDLQSIMDNTEDGYDAGRLSRFERELPGLLEKLHAPQQPQSMSLAALGQNVPQQQISRAPLPPVTDPATARVEQAFAAQGQGRNDLTNNQIAGRFLKTVRDGGVTNPYAIAAIAATGKHESGFDPKNAFGEWSDPSQSGQAGMSGGIMSWRAERLNNLRAFAQQAGDDPTRPSPETQAKFLLQEDPQLIQQLQAARSPQEAQQLMNNAWRFAGYNQPGGEAGARIASAQGYATDFGGSPSQSALEGIGVGQSVSMGGQGAMPPGELPGLPDGETMRRMFANPLTRPFAIEAARSRRQAIDSQNDPMKRIAYEKALLELENLRNPRGSPTDDMREYQFAKGQGFDGSLQDWITAGRKAGATNVNIGSEKGFDKTIGEGYGKRFLDIQDGAQAAQRALNALDVMEDSMSDPGFYSGAAAGSITSLKRTARALSIEGSDGIDSIETFNAMTKQAALDSMGGSLGSGFSNADRDFVLDQVPNLGNTPEGNKALIGVQRKLNTRKQQIAQFARQYAENNDGRIDAGFDEALAQWAERNPLFPAEPQGSGSSPGAGGSTGRQRARNPSTGELMEWDGKAWRPVK